nr:hypothetical protein [Clostridia bacterium]
MKKALASILALLMLIPAFAACSDSGAPKETTAPADTAVSETVETTTGKLTPDLPEKDFGGEKFTILTSGEADTNGYHWETYDVYAEAENGDVINDAGYARNMHIRETYNVEIAEVKSVTTTLAEAQEMVLAGEDVYDAVVTNLNSCATMAQEAQTYNMYDIPYIDFDQPWWDSNLVENLAVAGKINYATGDITVIDNDALWVLMYNKKMLVDYGIDDLYERVENDSWLFDDFSELCLSTSADLNGDGKMQWQDDLYGFNTGAYSAISVFYSSGLSFTRKNSDDLPEYAFDIDRASLIAEKMGALMGDSNKTLQSGTVTADEIRQNFEEGRSLFFGEVLQCVQRMRASETDFGLVPWPKFDENQENYGAVGVPSAIKAFTVPVTQADLELTGVVLEAMAAESMYTLTPAYYELALREKYMRDSESVKMLDIILANISIDLAYVYGWGNLPTLVMNDVKVNGGKLVSIIDSNLSAFDTAMQKTIDAYIG